jgi:antitoxin (DNA-binding transcriptional repressor) of toxin-antitoxin stability system
MYIAMYMICGGITMITVNVAELRAHLGEFLADVQKGQEVEICKRNKGVARMVRPPSKIAGNRTRLGSAKGSVRILGDIVSPAIPEDDWEMLR